MLITTRFCKIVAAEGARTEAFLRDRKLGEHIGVQRRREKKV